jgi:CubicO group peptidase (beta-lactamase class C family)
VAVHGWRDLERRLPMTPDTPSRWYSMSKPMTAVALGRLVEAGRLTWERPLLSLLPDLRFADAVATERANVADCLLHRTGLISGAWIWMGAPQTAETLMRRLPHVSCRFGYRHGFHYQNLNFTILGEVIKALGTDWHQVIREWLGLLGVRPLTRLGEFAASERALGYGPNGFMPARRMEDFDFEGTAAASSVCGSIKELAQVARLMALGGTVDGREIVSRAMWQELTRPVLALSDPKWPEMRHTCAALAGARSVYRGEVLLTWAGGFRGYTAHLVALPERRAAACAMVNRSASPASDLLAMSLLDRAAGWECLPWADRYLEEKRRNRKEGERRLAERLARPSAPWPFPVEAGCGWFEHPAYGELTVVKDGDGARLRFRNTDLPLTPRPDGTVSAEGGNEDSSEILWDLRPVLESGRVVAWQFSPDDPLWPCCFRRAEPALGRDKMGGTE